MIFFLVLNFLFFIYSSKRFLNNPFSYFNVFYLFYCFVIGLGLVSVFSYDVIVGFKMVTDGMDVVNYFFVVTAFLLPFVNGLLSTSSRLVLKELSASEVFSLRVLACISVFSMLVYVAASGVGAFSSGYESRYEEGQGMGFLLIFFPGFLPYYVYLIIRADSFLSSIKIFYMFLFVAVFTFILLSGYRQIFMAFLILSAIAFLYKGYIRRPMLVYFSSLILSLLLLIIMSFIRYSGEDSKTFDSAVEAAFYFLQGDLFPVDAPLKVLNFIEFYQYPGMDVFWNHLLRFVPRFLWEDKPLMLMNAAGYYTQVVVGYERAVTLSPTILSEGLLVGGYWGLFFIVIAAGLIMTLVDNLIKKSNGIFTYIMLTYSYMGFFVVREGLESGVYRIIVALLFFVLAYFFLIVKVNLKTRVKI